MALREDEIEISTFGQMLIVFIIIVNIISHLKNSFPKYRERKSIICGQLGFRNHL